MREALSLLSWRQHPLVIAGGVLAIALLLALANPHNTAVSPAAPGPARHIPIFAMVAARPIAAGTLITLADIRAKAYAGPAPAGAVLSRDAALGRLAARNFASGEALREDDLRDVATVGIGARVPAGERAFSINVTEDEIVGGFLQSGDRVDVFATIPGSVFPTIGAQNLPDRSQAVLLLQNVQVLAVGENPATRGSVQASARTVSLSLPPKQLARLTLALRYGKVSLAIRKPGDNGVAGPATATLADLLPAQPVSAPAARPARPRGIPFYTGAHTGVAFASERQ